MLVKEQKATAVQMAMHLEELNYDKEPMLFMFKEIETCPQREEILEFLRTSSSTTARLYLEIMELDKGETVEESGEVKLILTKEETKERLDKMMKNCIAKREAHGIEGPCLDYITLANALKYISK